MRVIAGENGAHGIRSHNVALFLPLEYERNNTGSVQCESSTIPASARRPDPSLNPLSLKRLR